MHNPGLSKTTTADMTVKITAVTDDVTLSWDSSKVTGAIGTLDGTSKVLTFNDITENNSNPKTGETKVENELNFGSLLTNTSGTNKAPFTDNPNGGDLDGSEKRSYTISLTPKEGTTLPDFIYITIGNQKDIKVNKTGTGEYKLDFDSANNKLENPDFKIKFPDYWSGEVKGTITLRTKDYGVDGDADDNQYVTGEEKGVKKAEVKFEVNVTPVANLATIEIEQAIGYEDDGRTGGNTTDKNGAITNPENGIPLSIKVTSDDKDSSETFDVTISNLPDNGVFYVNIPGTTDYVLVEKDASNVYKAYSWTEGTPGTKGTEYTDNKLVVEADGSGKYKITIKGLTNDIQPDVKFIPAHNDDTDYEFKVNATTSDGDVDEAVAEEVTIDVIVKNKADAPVGTELTTDGSKLITVGDNSYIKATEDININLKDIYNKPGDLNSYDSDSEELTVKINLQEGFTLDAGTPYHIENGLYVVKADDILSDKVKIKFPEHFSGDAQIELTYVTTEKAGENDSKTWHTDKVNISVTPDVDGVLKNKSEATEETSTNYIKGTGANAGKSFYNLDLGLDDKGDTNEYISSIKFTIPSSGYDLYIKNDANFTKITDTNKAYSGDELKNIYVQVNEHFSGDVAVKIAEYEIKDKTNNTSVEVSKTETNYTHTLSIKPVTDKPDIVVNNTTSTDTNKATVSGDFKTITVLDNSAEFTVRVNTTSPDTDNSETVQRIEISGVPKGVEIEGAKFEGYKDGSGVWVITNPTDIILNNDGAFTDIKFIVHNGDDFNNRIVTIKTFTKDGTASENDDFVNITLNDTRGTKGGNGTDVLPNFTLTPKDTAISEDMGNKGDGGNESNPLKLGDLFNVENYTVTNPVTNGYNWAVTFTDIPAGSKVIGLDGRSVYSYEDGGKTYYVVSGTTTTSVTPNDIQTELNKVQIILPKDKNSGQDAPLKSDFSITGNISVTKNGTSYESPEAKIENREIAPVTDPMKVEIVATGEMKEDKPVNLKITLSNDSDKTKTVLVGNSLTIKITETWKDSLDGGVGTKGTLAGANYIITESPAGTYTITKKDGTPFTIDTPITGLVYTPATNRDGDVEFEVSVQNKEGDSVELTSKGEANIAVKPVIDLDLRVETIVTKGIEDKTIDGIALANPMKLEFTFDSIIDSSESFGNIILDRIPNGFTVWYKDGTELKMATNIGESTGLVNIYPNLGTGTTFVNQWMVPQIGTGNTLPEIYINAPTNWAGDITFDTTFIVKEQNGDSVKIPVTGITGTITPVADGVTIAPTLTFGDAFSWLDLKLNANMKDVDGSEVMNLELTGLSASSQFRIEDGAVLDNKQAVWDEDTSKWTISGIKFDEIGKIQFTSDTSVKDVKVQAWTQEIDSEGNPLVIESDKTLESKFDVNVKDVTGNFKLDKDMSLDFNNIQDKTSMKNITSIDLSVDGENKLENLKLQDVLAMTNSSKELIIKGDSNDKVSFKNEDGQDWKKLDNITEGEKTYLVYSNQDESLKVKVENTIDSQGIIS